VGRVGVLIVGGRSMLKKLLLEYLLREKLRLTLYYAVILMYSICQHSTSIGASTNSGGIEGPATDLELRNNPPFPFPLSMPTIS